MTKVKVKKVDNKIVSVECDGHTGYGVEGEDIVCAALSSIVQTALLGLLQVAKLDPIFKIDDQKGYMKMDLPDGLSSQQRHDADIILETLLIGINDLYQSFSDFIELEVL